MTGLNDARLYGRSAAAAHAYGSAVTHILARFRAAASGALILAIEQPHLVDYSGFEPHNQGSDEAVDDYNEVLRQVVRREPHACYVPVPVWDAGEMLADDTVHPNDTGHAYLAQQIVSAIHAWPFPDRRTTSERTV